MGWDGAGGYTRQHNFSADASAGINILAARMDQEINDIASAIPIAWARNGQNTPTTDMPMGGRKFVNVGAPTSVSDFMRSREFIENVPIFMQDVESSADRISVSSQYFTSVSANQAPVDGTKIIVRAKSNKSSAALYLDGHSANVIDPGGSRAGDVLTSGGIYEFIYRSADVAWQPLNRDLPFYRRTSTEISAGVTPTYTQYPELNVKRYGALGDDSTDDTTAIQNALNVAVAKIKADVIFPNGIYRHTALTLAPAASQIHVNLIGDGGIGGTGTALKYTGTNGIALTITNNTRYTIEKIRLVNAGSGTTTGLALRSLAAGSNHGVTWFPLLHINGFTTGLQIGTSADLAASELAFGTLEVGNCTTGVLVEGINSLGISIEQFAAFSCTTAFKWTGATDRNAQTVRIGRASLSSNTTDFQLDTGIHLTLDTVYTEGAVAGAKFINTASAANSAPPIYVCVRNGDDVRSGSAKNVLAWPGTYIFENFSTPFGTDVGDAGSNNRYHLIYFGGVYVAPTYAAGSDSVVFVSVRGVGTNGSNNQGIADILEYVFLNGGTQRTLYTYGWSGHPTVAIPTAIPQFNNGLATQSAALATNATDGFLYVPTCAGTPSGTPTSITGCAPIIVNTTNNKLYFYSGGAWRDAGP